MHLPNLRVPVLCTVLFSSGVSAASPSQATSQPASCPATGCKKGDHWPTMPAEAKEVIDRFVKAAAEKKWEKALSYCSPRTQARARCYEQDDYFRLFIPLQQLQAASSYTFSTYSRNQASGDYSYFGCFLKLSETPDGYRVNWVWWLEKTERGWRIDLPDVPIERWAEEEIARQKKLKDKSDARWRALQPKLEGVHTRLSTRQVEYHVGQPIPFRLELVNGGKYPLKYDDQQVEVNGSMTITDENGRRVRSLEGPVQTGGWFAPIEPGQTIVLFDSLDMAKKYDLSKPGKYCVQFSGGGLMIADEHAAARCSFPSYEISIEVKP